MRNTPGLHLICLALAMICSLPGCNLTEANTQNESPTNPPIADGSSPMKQETFRGTIVYKTLEGGFYALHTQKAQHFTLKDLPTPFRRNGLIVDVTGYIDNNAITITQYGKVFIVSSVTIIDDSQVNPIGNPIGNPVKDPINKRL